MAKKKLPSVWGTVKVKGIRNRQDACWINGELTRMATKVDPYGGILSCTLEEELTFKPRKEKTHEADNQEDL